MAETIEIKILETGNVFIDEKELFTVEEIMAKSGKTRQTVYNWVDSFKITRIEIKGRPLFYFNE